MTRISILSIEIAFICSDILIAAFIFCLLDVLPRSVHANSTRISGEPHIPISIKVGMLILRIAPNTTLP